MQIIKSEFIRSISSGEQCFNQDLPEIAIAGKSNVGKSSLINLLTNNRKLAKVSKQPGKTRVINYFLLNQSFYLVDLPGYGFARAPKSEKKQWNDMMDSYFQLSPQLRALLILMDIRHNPTSEDKAMVQYADYYSIPYAVVATKADKIAKSKRKMECNRMRKEIPSSIEYEIIPVSSESKFGKEALLSVLSGFLEDSAEGMRP